MNRSTLFPGRVSRSALHRVFALACMVVTAGCSSAEHRSATEDQQLTEAPGPGELGGFCGGIGFIQCNDGLACELHGDYPDAGGTCVAAPEPGELGGFCGGIEFIQCSDGLVCELHGDYPDAGGTCVAAPEPGELGGFCGGIGLIPCNDGLVCEVGGDYPDAGGNCIKATK